LKKFSLSSNERIKKANDFKLIYNSGNVIYSKNNTLKTNYITKTKSENYGIKIAVAVNRKVGNAVWRNRIKRLIRNSYRVNKNEILDFCIEERINLYMIFSPITLNENKNKKISLKEIMPEIIEMMNRIKDSL
jgi:ribonuclease P protein component